MKTLHILLIAALTLTACGGSTRSSDGEFVGYVDDTVNPEDMALVPDTSWVVASTDKTPGKAKPAYLYVIDSRTGIAVSVDAKLAPSATAGDPSCKPIQLSDLALSGLGMRPGNNNSHQLLAVNRGERMSIEFFEINVSGSAPAFTWTGCLMMPAKAFPNDVVATRDGGLAVTVSYEIGNDKLIEQLERRENTGYLLEWTKEAGFARVPGSELPLDNGVEVDASGSFYYVAGWGGETLLRLPTSPAMGKPLLVDIGMKPDNLTWTQAGTLIVAAHTQSPTEVFTCVGSSADMCPVPFKIIEVDPETLKTIRVLVDGDDTDTYAGATTGLKVGDEIWASSFRYDKIARYRKK